MGTIKVYLIILAAAPVLLYIVYKMRLKSRKPIEANAMNLDTYIANLEFNPTAIYTSVVCIPHKKDASLFSKKSIDVFSRAKTLSSKYKSYIQQSRPYSSSPLSNLTKFGLQVDSPSVDSFWYPQLGVFLDSEKKLFAIRSNVEETMPKVYKFSQLQGFEISEDVRESMRGAVLLPYVPIAIGFGGNPLGELSMRIVFSGTSGPESVILEPVVNITGEKSAVIQKRTNDPVYKLKCEELVLIADCLQWIQDNA